MDNQRFNYPTTTTATRVGDLPVGLLGRAVIQHLPWGKRVQVEGVCTQWQREARTYGWEDVKHLKWGSGAVHLQHASWMPLLSRVCLHLTSLDIAVSSELGEDELLAGLVECPKLRHLSVGWRQLTPPVLDHICRAYASKLKSLRLFAKELDDPETATALNDALCRLPSLEYLRVDDWALGASRLRFYRAVASQLGNLRRLVLDWCGINQGCFESLTALPSLRSLTLQGVGMVGGMNYSDLQRFIRLEHLNIRINASNVGSFVEALPHLGASLKALEVPRDLHVTELRQLIPPITAYLHRLEHLELWVGKPKQHEELEEIEQQLGLLAAPQLKSLRSLSIWADPADWMWGWLERICREHQQRLEYLELYDAPPLSIICKIVKECKSLNGLKFVKDPEWDGTDLVMLAEAASAAAIDDGNEEGPKSLSIPSLCIAFYRADKFQKIQIDHSSRLRFASEDELFSRVLYQHRYGCLSEGLSAFPD